jgi:hypothetical protein
MPIVVGVARITLNEDGSVDLLFSDSSGVSFASLAELTAFAADAEGPQARALALQMLVRWWLLRDALAESPGIVVGKTLTLDLTRPLMLEVS